MEDSAALLPKNMELVNSSPNVYKVHNFLSEKEIIYLEDFCRQYDKKFQSSFTENENNEEVISLFRTSNFIHLAKAQDATIRRIETRAAELVGMNNLFVEPLQIVRYREGQFFDVHHDAGTLLDDGSVELVAPRRFATLFLYLNTLPKGQGHTEFPHDDVKLSVRPERGCGVLWCNIDKSGEPDPTTIHKACPVTGSHVKYGVNVWISEQNHGQLALVKPRTLLKKAKKGSSAPSVNRKPTKG